MFDEVVRGIRVYESENPPALVDLEREGAFFFSRIMAQRFLIRREICKKLVAAQEKLPSGYRFMIFEGFRPRSRQVELWNNYLAEIQRENPAWNEAQCVQEAESRGFVANPHGLSGGHQAGAAIDLTLCSTYGQEFFMGTILDAFGPKCRTDCTTIMPEEVERRKILCGALESEGLVNLPEEWWHFSYGDRAWAELTGRKEAFYAPVD